MSARLMRFFPKKKLSALQLIDKCIRFRQKKISKNLQVEKCFKSIHSKNFFSRISLAWVMRLSRSPVSSAFCLIITFFLSSFISQFSHHRVNDCHQFFNIFRRSSRGLKRPFDAAGTRTRDLSAYFC